LRAATLVAAHWPSPARPSPATMSMA
jgi:hypothetical protein